MIGWLTAALSITGKLTKALAARDNAKTDAERIAADVQIEALRGRLASKDNVLVQWGLGIVAVAMCGHAAAVAVVSMVPGLGLVIQALPPVYADMQQALILSGFGLVAVGRFFR